MQWTDQQYDRVARYLDGDPLELTDLERDLVEQVHSGLDIVQAGVDLQKRHQAMDKARRRMSAELARPARRKAVLACFTAAEAIAVAAVLVIALALQAIKPATGPLDLWAAVPIEAIGLGETNAITERISLVARDIDMLEVDLLMPATTMDPASFEIDQLKYDLEQLWNYEPVEFYLEG